MNRRHIVRSGYALVACLLLLVSASCGGGGGGVVVVPSLTITKTANPLSVPETGGNVTYTISIHNTGDEDVTIDSLTDDKFADIATVCLPSVIGAVLNPNDVINCQFTKNVAGASGTPHVNTATVNGTASPSGAPVTAHGNATVTFTNVLQSTFVADNTAPGSNTISMQPGASSGTNFNVEIRVQNIDNLFGVAFHLTYDPAVASFTGFSSGTLLGNPPPQFDVADLGGGQLAVVASLQGQVAGVPSATGLLLTLSFQGTAATTNSAFTFTPSGSREVQTCPAPPGACSQVQGSVTWSGGKLTVN